MSVKYVGDPWHPDGPRDGVQTIHFCDRDVSDGLFINLTSLFWWVGVLLAQGRGAQEAVSAAD